MYGVLSQIRPRLCLAVRVSARLGLVSLLLAAACTGEQGDYPTVSRQDSTGVEIVETQHPVWTEGERWTIEELPRLEIGKASGESDYMFYRVAGALRLKDGRIAVADNFANQLRFYSPEGTFLKAVGRKGNGPGEYEYIRSLARCGADSILAFDLHWQVKVYTAAGNLIREMRLYEPESYRTPYHLACSPAGYFVIIGWGEDTFESVISLYQTHAHAYLLDREGQAVVDLGEFLVSERIGNVSQSSPHPFGRSTATAIGEEAIYIGTAQCLEVQVFALDGQLTAIWRGPAEDLSIRSQDLARYRQDQLASVDESQRASVERYLRELPIPEQFPAYTQFRLDSSGCLWVRRFQKPGNDKELWAVFSRNGAMLGDVQFPPDIEVTDIGADYILGVVKDEMGAERIRLYGLRRP